MARLTANDLRTYVPTQEDPYDQAFYQRVADRMDMESAVNAQAGITSTIYYDTITNTQDYDPPLPPLSHEQYDQMIERWNEARSHAEANWSQDPNQERAQKYRDNFDKMLEEYKRRYRP
jgi:hypothetical protein